MRDSGGVPDGRGLVTRKTRSDEKLGIFSSIPHSFEKGEGLEIKLMIDHASVIKLSRSPYSERFRGLLGPWARVGAGRAAPCRGCGSLVPVSHTSP